MSLEESINRLAAAVEKLGGPVTFIPDALEPAKPARRGAVPRVVPEPTAPKYEDVREAILDLAEKKGMPAAVEVLEKFEVTHAKSLKPEQWADALKAAHKALAA